MNAVNQRHNLVLVFTDLSGSTRIAANAEPELYAELIAELRGLTATIVERHGGEVVRIDGDGALCIFGYPIAHEDAGRRAVEAALDLHAAVATLETGLSGADAGIAMHTGIHAGVVLLRTGDVVSGRYEMLGDATNVAARLCDAAGPGEVLVSAETLGPDRHLFASGPERAVQVAGRRPPMQALPVTGRSAAATRFAARTRDVLTPFTGRQAERAAFAQWLASPPSGAPALLVHGPAGIGKSRLLGELADDAALVGWRTVRGYCEAYLGARPLQPFRQVARQLGATDGDGAAAFEAAILQAAAAAPLLVELDDWQWADDASRDLLASLRIAAEAAGLSGRLRLLLASREEPDAQAGEAIGLVVPLPPLSAEQCRDTISVLLRSFDTFALKRIEQASGGSPLLIEELCHAFTGGRPAPDSDPRGSWFDLAVQARFARLDPADQDLLRLAAAIGHIVPTGLLAAVRGEAIGGEALARLEQADFLFAGATPDTLRFKHGLTRDAVYAVTGMADRRALHRQVLTALQAQAEQSGEVGLLDMLAWHSTAAGLAGPGLDYSIRAGDAALTAGALDRAQAHYRTGIELARNLPESDARSSAMRSLLNKFGLASIVDPSGEQLETLGQVRDFMQATGDRIGLIRGAYWLGAIGYGLGRGKESVTYLSTAVELCEGEDTRRHRDQAALKLAQSLFTAGRYVEAEALFEQLLPVLRQGNGPHDRDASAYALACFGFHKADQGDFSAAAALFDAYDALVGADPCPMNASYFGYRAVSELWRGEWQQGIEFANQAVASSKRARARFQAAINPAKIAYANWKLTEDERFLVELEDWGRWFLAKGNSQQRASLVFGWLAEAFLTQGDMAKGRYYVAQLVRRVQNSGDRLGEAMGWRALARIEGARGEQDRATRSLEKAARSSQIRSSRREAAQDLLCRAELDYLGGDVAAARAASAKARQEFAAMGMTWFENAATAFTSRLS